MQILCSTACLGDVTQGPESERIADRDGLVVAVDVVLGDERLSISRFMCWWWWFGMLVGEGSFEVRVHWGKKKRRKERRGGRSIKGRGALGRSQDCRRVPSV